MFEAIIDEMKSSFRKGVFDRDTTFHFSVDDLSVVITVGPESFNVEQGAAAAKADCYCKTSRQMFSKIWHDGYRPGIMDFLGGAIKSDAPLLLAQYLKAFGK